MRPGHLFFSLLKSPGDYWASQVAQWVKNSPANAGNMGPIQSLGQEDPLEKEMATHSSILAGKFHGQRSLVGYSPWGRKESDMTEHSKQTMVLAGCLIYSRTV